MGIRVLTGRPFESGDSERAAPVAISGLVVRQGMTPAIAGLGVGIVASLAIGRVVESLE
jgi:hypothetical protein